MSKLLFIGAGKMASAIAGGIVASQVYSAHEMAAFDINPDAASAFTAATGVPCLSDITAALADAEKVLAGDCMIDLDGIINLDLAAGGGELTFHAFGIYPDGERAVGGLV